jgi:hypothetical protein
MQPVHPASKFALGLNQAAIECRYIFPSGDLPSIGQVGGALDGLLVAEDCTASAPTALRP